MKIKYIVGDLFKTDITHIIHGCNAQGVMGSGVAAIIRQQFPQAYYGYRDLWSVGTQSTVGDIQFFPAHDKVIINAITQEFYGGAGLRWCSYDGIAEALSQIDTELEKQGITEVAMPMIGAGLAGGDWNVIEKIIESEMKMVQPVVYMLEDLRI